MYVENKMHDSQNTYMFTFCHCTVSNWVIIIKIPVCMYAGNTISNKIRTFLISPFMTTSLATLILPCPFKLISDIIYMYKLMVLNYMALHVTLFYKAVEKLKIGISIDLILEILFQHILEPRWVNFDLTIVLQHVDDLWKVKGHRSNCLSLLCEPLIYNNITYDKTMPIYVSQLWI